MESPSLKKIRMMAYGIVVGLALILIGVLGYGYASKNAVTHQVLTVKGVTLGGLRSKEAASAFDVSVLQHPVYIMFNRALLDAGRLPVPPPVARGKVNLFGL